MNPENVEQVAKQGDRPVSRHLLSSGAANGNTDWTDQHIARKQSQNDWHSKSLKDIRDLSPTQLRQKVATNATSGCYWLSSANPKTIKGVSENYVTATLSLAPARYSNHTTCYRFKHCGDTCLYHQGRGKFAKIAEARIRKTNLFFEDQEVAGAAIHSEIRRIQRKLNNSLDSPNLAVRLNTFSDLKWEKMRFKSLGDKSLLEANPSVQFYDYTKYPYTHRKAWSDMPINYHLTYSYDGTEEDIPNAKEILNNGHNVAIVYSKPNYKDFLERLAASGGGLVHTWGYPMVNNETSDNRFLDPSPVILIGKEKGFSNISV